MVRLVIQKSGTITIRSYNWPERCVLLVFCSPTGSSAAMNMDGELHVDDVSNDELSDSLTMLLNNLSDSETSSSQASSPPDWAQLSSLWPQQPLDLNSDQNSKFPDLGGSFNFSFPMDLDLNAALSMAVDPSTLHYHNTSPQTMFDMNSLHIQPQDLLSSFPFTFSSPTLSSASASSSSADEKSPRMGISSGTSVSPVMVPISSGTGMRGLFFYLFH